MSWIWKKKNIFGGIYHAAISCIEWVRANKTPIGIQARKTYGAWGKCGWCFNYSNLHTTTEVLNKARHLMGLESDKWWTIFEILLDFECFAQLLWA